MMRLIFKISLILTFSLIFMPVKASGGPVIYIIRHAEVDAGIPGWSSSKETKSYREKYNQADIRDFNPANTLEKIDSPGEVDTVFCSPQQRAIETALRLFNNDVVLNINDNLREFQYPVVEWPVLRMPVRTWMTISFISWLAGNNNHSLPTYRARKQNLENYSEELIRYANRHGQCVVVAHGVVNRQLIRILKKKGWKYYQNDGNGNLSVNRLEL